VYSRTAASISIAVQPWFTPRIGVKISAISPRISASSVIPRFACIRISGTRLSTVLTVDLSIRPANHDRSPY
jgi:hypothetical protein